MHFPGVFCVNSNSEKPDMTLQVTLINFGDSPRVFYDVHGKAKQCIPGGIIKDFEMSERGLQRVGRDETMVTLSGDVTAKSALLAGLLDTLAQWGTLSVEEKQTRTERVFGVGALGQRPTDYEMRHALAVRSKEAARYIQMGSLDTAEEVLGARLPTREEQLAKIEEAKAAAKANDPMYVRGDDEKDKGDGRTTAEPNRTLRPIRDNGSSDAKLVQSDAGPGLTLPATDAGDGESAGDRRVFPKIKRPVRRARREEPKPQPQRVKRVKNPPRKARPGAK